MKSLLPGLQAVGRALMLPIAVLPIAGLLLRLGQPDLLDIPFVAASGAAIFSHLGPLFAIGVAIGIARENHGAAGLAAMVAYVVALEGAKALMVIPPEVTLHAPDASQAAAAYREAAATKFSLPVGILCGLIAGGLYNRFHTVRLPEYLAFFGGRRSVPIAAGVAGLALAGVFGLGWSTLESGIDGASRAVLGAGEGGLFIYGALNRFLIVTGLHHVLNNIAWFLLGSFNGVTGDLNRFFAGDPEAGAFMAGFFPVMMFGLPAACLAMYHAAPRERRKEVAGLLLSMALTSFLTGVTEPVEFTFMFVAPMLYVAHAALTGLAHVLMDLLGVKLGFTFSAGALDYVLSYRLGTRPWMLLPIGVLYSALYYGLFRVCIALFDLATPGRGERVETRSTAPRPHGGRGRAFIEALGGAENLVSVNACTTRLRLEIVDLNAVDEVALKALAVLGIVRPGGSELQVVVGPSADQVAGEMRAEMRAGAATHAHAHPKTPRDPTEEVSPDHPTAARSAARRATAASEVTAASGATAASEATAGSRATAASGAAEPAASEPDDGDADDGDASLAATLLPALGGAANVRALTTCASRMRVDVVDRTRVDLTALDRIATRGIACPSESTVHILLGPRTGAVARNLRAALGPLHPVKR